MSRPALSAALVLLLAAIAGCDKVALLAPTGSEVILSIGSTSVGATGTVEVVASVIEAGGTPVHNGTEVTFQASVGTVDPVTARTESGIARTTFRANGASGTARIAAFSGGARATEVELLVGGAAVETLTVRVEPNSLTNTGGPVQVTATAVDASGNPIAGAPVVFSSTTGTLSATQVSTDASGQARTTLTTTREATVRASVGGKTAEAELTLLAQPTVGLTATPPLPAVGLPVTFTITPATAGTNGSPVRSVTFDPGDGSGVRTLGAGTTTVTHIYDRENTYTARAVATDAAGQTGEGTIVVRATRVLPIVSVSVSGGGFGGQATITVNSSAGTSPTPGPPVQHVVVTVTSGSGASETYRVGPGQQTIQASFPPGRYTVTATAFDAAGGQATVQTVLSI